MIALPTTPHFIDYEAVYLPKNHFIKDRNHEYPRISRLILSIQKAELYESRLKSLLLVIQLIFSFMLTDKRQSLRLRKHCHKVYMASNPKAVFCSPRCKNQFNVYKRRGKKDKEWCDVLLDVSTTVA